MLTYLQKGCATFRGLATLGPGAVPDEGFVDGAGNPSPLACTVPSHSYRMQRRLNYFDALVQPKALPLHLTRTFSARVALGFFT